MATLDSMQQIELAQLIVSVDDGRAVGDVFKLPADLRTVINDRLADLLVKDSATAISESARAGASANVRTSLTKLENLLTDGYNFIKGLGSYAITDAQRLAVFIAYGWESGLMGRFSDDRIEAMARQAITATPTISDPAWRYPAPLLTLITAELATLNANQPSAQTGVRQAAVAARDEAVRLMQTANDRVRFFYCSASDDEDRTTELARIGRQPRRARGQGSGGGLTAPGGLTLASGEDGTVDVHWNEVDGAQGYIVSRQRLGLDTGWVEEPTTFFENQATIGPFAAGQVVRVQVRAYRGDEQGPESTTAEITMNGGGGSSPAAPGAPTLTALVDGQIHAVWTAVPGALHYRIYRQIIGQELDYVFVGPAASLFATLNGLPPGEIVRVRISAVNTFGESEPGPFAEITTIE